MKLVKTRGCTEMAFLPTYVEYVSSCEFVGHPSQVCAQVRISLITCVDLRLRLARAYRQCRIKFLIKGNNTTVLLIFQLISDALTTVHYCAKIHANYIIIFLKALR